ncbi:MAG: uracil-DNA glycosylase family protein [Myxococcota bacterium]
MMSHNSSTASARDAALRRLYKARRFIGDDGTPRELPRACEKAKACWAAAARRLPNTQCATEISPPWIGARYDEGRVLVVLANLYDYGGCDFGPNATVGMRFLGAAARAGFAHGHRRLFGGNGYRGTDVWSQAVHYAAAWLDVLGRRAAGNVSQGRFTPTVLADTMDLIAIAQHVKCSPRGNRSAPTQEMWSHCGAHVLGEEIEILQPEAIIVLGSGDNWNAFWPKLAPVDHGRARRAVGRGWIEHSFRTTHCGRTVEVLVTPHPAGFGMTSQALVREVHRLLHERTAVFIQSDAAELVLQSSSDFWR